MSPIKILADRMEGDEKRRVTIYRGDAVITQGTLKITGETVKIYFSSDDEFVKLVSEGSRRKPAHVHQLPDGKDEYQTAEAMKVEYFADQSLIVLSGRAVYGQGSDQIRADRIQYDALNGRMLANSNASRKTADGSTNGESSGRVSLIIKPKKKRAAKEDSETATNEP